MLGSEDARIPLWKKAFAVALLLSPAVSLPVFANEACEPRDFAFPQIASAAPTPQGASGIPSVRPPVQPAASFASGPATNAGSALPVALQRMKASGATIHPLPSAPTGVDGYLVTQKDRFQVFYVTPTGHFIGGTMFDPNGRDVTTEAVKQTPAAAQIFQENKEIPTSQVQTSGDILADLKTSSYTSIGKKGGKTVWAVIDVNCGHSVNAVSMLTQAMQTQDIELRLVPVAIMKPESLPQGADLLTSSAPLDAWAQRRLKTEGVSAVAMDGVRGNQQVYNAHKLRGTPVLVGTNAKGEPDVEVGVPPDMAPFLARIR